MPRPRVGSATGGRHVPSSSIAITSDAASVLERESIVPSWCRYACSIALLHASETARIVSLAGRRRGPDAPARRGGAPAIRASPPGPRGSRSASSAGTSLRRMSSSAMSSVAARGRPSSQQPVGSRRRRRARVAREAGRRAVSYPRRSRRRAARRARLCRRGASSATARQSCASSIGFGSAQPSGGDDGLVERGDRSADDIQQDRRRMAGRGVSQLAGIGIERQEDGGCHAAVRNVHSSVAGRSRPARRARTRARETRYATAPSGQLPGFRVLRRPRR